MSFFVYDIETSVDNNFDQWPPYITGVDTTRLKPHGGTVTCYATACECYIQASSSKGESKSSQILSLISAMASVYIV